MRALATQLKVAEDEAPWTTAELTEVREQLVELIGLNRTEVQHGEVELDSLMRGPGTGAGDDQADAGAKTFEREHEIAIVNNTRDVLEQTEHALERLDAGTYGICENCGKPIGKLRLQARPRATLCLSCQNKQARH
ncbi:MAG: TraR/DksA C4-type zinc finger protein [Dermatophilaceae bacterium]